ncbi:MAG: SIR2 family protein, partial [candidate division KSB1 bacterium]|nr:SIR2 family protein [candidate division KSB1 bacterium]
MKILDLKTAARQITAACQAKRERSPFFFITGAGLSTPSVPLAAEIVQHCKTRAVELYGTPAPPASDALTVYSHWFEHAYPNAEERRAYLQGMIEGRAVTTANLRLAHLLLNCSPSNLVITTNFDDLLSRSLLLFGKPHVLCDHPSTIGRIQPEREHDIQIVHVHGSYWFYDCCNLKDEIAARAQRSPNLPFDMSAFLDHVLHNRSPLVLGYGGWEGDVVMSALRRRLYHNEQPNALGYNVYWFLYERGQVAALPRWLQEHPNVVFVAKPEPAATSEAYMESGAEKMSQRAARPTDLEKDKRDLILPGHEVFDELIRAFKLPAPELVQDPLGFFIKSLRQSLPPDQPGNAQPDIYLMRSMLDRLAWAKQKLAETLQHMETQLESVRDALRRAQYREALQLGAGIPPADLSEEQRRELLRLMWEAADALDDRSEDELVGYERIEAACASLPGLDAETQVLLARALLRKGYVLGQLNRSEEALAAYDEVLRRFGEATELPLREQVARALVNKGYRLGQLNRSEEELAAYDEVLRRFGEATELPLREQVARALVNKGYRLGQLNRSEEELAAYD